MALAEKQGAAQRSQHVRGQIRGIIPAAARDMALVPFIQHADGANDRKGDHEDLPPIGLPGLQPVKEGGKENAASEEVTEMEELVAELEIQRWREMVHLRGQPPG